MRRLLRLVGLLSVAGLVLALGYFVKKNLSAPPALNNPEASSSATKNNTPGSPAQSAVLAAKVVEPQVLAFFVYNDGTFSTLGISGEVRQWRGSSFIVLSSSSLSGVSSAVFSPDGQKVLIGLGTQSDAQFRIFDLAQREWRFLPSGVRSPAWAPNSKDVAYFDFKGTSPTLSILSSLKPLASSQKLTVLPLEDGVLAWPDAKHIYVSARASAILTGSAWDYDIAQKTMRRIIPEARGLSALWSGQSKGLVFSAKDSLHGGQLELRRGTNMDALSFLTLPEKCVFFTAQTSQTSIICAVPTNDDFGNALLPDDYLKRGVVSADAFYIVNPDTGDLTEIANGGTYDAVNLRVAANKVFFINRLDGLLYSLALNPK